MCEVGCFDVMASCPRILLGSLVFLCKYCILFRPHRPPPEFPGSSFTPTSHVLESMPLPHTNLRLYLRLVQHTIRTVQHNVLLYILPLPPPEMALADFHNPRSNEVPGSSCTSPTVIGKCSLHKATYRIVEPPIAVHGYFRKSWGWERRGRHPLMSQVLLMRSLVVVVAGGGGRGNVIPRIAYFFLTIGCHILDRAECDRCGARDSSC